MVQILKIKRHVSAVLLIFLFTVVNSCTHHIAFYDQYAYTQATSLKVDLQNLASESSSVAYADAKEDIDKVNVEMEKAFEYSNGRSKNTISTDQYKILLGENNFYKSFLQTWNTQSKLSPAAADEVSKKIGQIMDQIIALESGKTKTK
jgi:hypothetical protein